MSSMIRRRLPRRAHPGQPFVISILVLSLLALLSLLVDAGRTYREHLPGVLERREIGLFGAGDEQCRLVHKAADQCAFIRNHCPDEEAGLFSYLTLYYCRLPNAKPLGFLVIVIWTGLLFSTIGVAASDFFCVNLSTISNILGMSESFAGVTFLAFGNGSPDVFSTFAAIKSHSGSMAVGELIGAAGFITAVVSGSMAIIRPFKVAKKSFVRDVLFFIVATCFSMSFLANGSLALWECAVMVGFYVFYVLVVVFWHYWLGRRRRRREKEIAARGHFVLPDGDEAGVQEPYRDEDEDGSRNPASSGVSAEDFNDLERADFVDPDHLDEDEEEEEHDKWLGELNSNMRITRASDGERRNVFNPIRPSLVGALEFRALLSSLQKAQTSKPLPLNARRYSEAEYLSTSQHNRSFSEDQTLESSQLQIPHHSQDHAKFDHGNASTTRRRSSMFPRGRAVSVNDASQLHLDIGPFPRDLLPTFDFSNTQSEENNDNRTNSSKGGKASTAPQSPVISVSPAVMDSDLNEEIAPTRPSRSRASTGPHLTLPESTIRPTHQRQRTLSRPEAVRREVRLPSRSRSSSYFNPKTSQPSSNLTSPSHTPTITPRAAHRSDLSPPPEDISLPSPSIMPASDFPPLALETGSNKPWRWWPHEIFPPPGVIARTLFPTLYGWHEKSIWEKLLGIAASPSFFLLTITLPVVELEVENEQEQPSADASKTPLIDIGPEEPETEPVRGGFINGSVPAGPQTPGAISIGSNHPHRRSSMPIVQPNKPLSDQDMENTNKPEDWHRWLVIVQCFTAPFFIVFVIWANTSTDPRDLLRPTLYSLLSSSIALFLLILTTDPYRPPRWRFLLCFAGFAVSITWISTIANEVVGVLKTIGVIFNMSDSILGLTIFAVGNSLGDLVADITVARLGYPVMALSACFGGPLLNILLGIGLSGLYVVINGAEKRQHKHPGSSLKFKPYHVQVSTTLLISAVALLVTLVGLLIVVPLNGWRMDKRIGWGLIILWCLTTVGNVVVEVLGLSDESLRN